MGPAASLAAKLNRPSRLLMGLGGQATGATVPLANAQGIRADIIEAYLVGAGPGDWTTWNLPSGYFVQVLAHEAESMGAVPMYTLYGMAQNGAFNLSGLSTQAFMNIYWANAKLLYQQIAISGAPALVNIEPDFWGVTYEQSNGNPATLFAYVSSNPDCTDQPNNVSGIAGCLIEMRNKYAPLAYVGFPPADWGFGAAKVVAYMNAVGAQHADFIVAQTLDRDAGCYEVQGAGCSSAYGPWYWDETNQTHPNFQDHLTEIQAFHTGIGNLPVIWWQTPMGVPSSTPGGSEFHYRDNRVHYFLTNPTQLTAVGGLAVVFGDGTSGQTDIATDGGEFAQLESQYLSAPAKLP